MSVSLVARALSGQLSPTRRRLRPLHSGHPDGRRPARVVTGRRGRRARRLGPAPARRSLGAASESERKFNLGRKVRTRFTGSLAVSSGPAAPGSAGGSRGRGGAWWPAGGLDSRTGLQTLSLRPG